MTTRRDLEFGYTKFNDKTYLLTELAEPTSRCLPAPYVNSCDVNDGDTYDFEIGAHAIDRQGHNHFVTWIFSGTKGEDKEIDSYDYSVATKVTDL